MLVNNEDVLRSVPKIEFFETSHWAWSELYIAFELLSRSSLIPRWIKVAYAKTFQPGISKVHESR